MNDSADINDAPVRRRRGGGAKRMGYNVLSTVATRMLQITVLVWVNQYLLKRIDPQEYSLFPLVTSLIFFIQFVATITTGGISRFLVVADSRDDHEELTRITTSMIPILLGTVVLLIIGGGIAVWRIEEIIVVAPQYRQEAQIMLSLILGYLCYNIISTPFSAGMYIRGRFTLLSVVQLTCEAVRTVLILILLLGVSTRVVWMVLGTLAAEVLNTTWRVAYTRKHLPAIHVAKGSFCSSTAKQLTQFGAWTSVTGIGDFVSKTAPILLLNRYGTAIDVSSFHLGRLPDFQIRRIISSAMIPFQPIITRIYATEGEDALLDVFYRGNRYCLWVALAMLAPLIIFSDRIVSLYVGNEYSQAATVMSLMLARYPFLFAIAMFYRVSHATAKVKAYYLCEIAIQLTTLVAMYVAVVFKSSGAVGVAVAMSLTEGLLNLVLVWKLSLVNVRGRWKPFLKLSVLPGCLPFAMAVASCLALRSISQLSNWPILALASIVAGVIYVATMMLFCLDELDRELASKAKSVVTKKIAALPAILRPSGAQQRPPGELNGTLDTKTP